MRDGDDGRPADGVPEVARAPVQYGPTVRSVAAYLVAGHHLPLGRAAGVLGDLLAAPVSPGSISRWLGVAADRLAPFLTTLRDQFAAAEVVHFDETGLQVDGRLGWVHSASTATLSLFTPPQAGPGRDGCRRRAADDARDRHPRRVETLPALPAHPRPVQITCGS